MKYILLILIGLLPVGLFAQYHEIGLSAGANVGTFNHQMKAYKDVAHIFKERGWLPFNLEPKIKTQFSLNYQYHFKDSRWAAQAKIGYYKTNIFHSLINSSDTTQNNGISFYTTNNSYYLDYITTNISGIYYITPRLYGSLGVYIGQLLPSSYHIYREARDNRNLYYEKDKFEDWKKTDVGGSIEIGYRLGKNRRWQVNLSSLLGARVISPPILPVNEYQFLNASYQLSVGYWFGFKQKE